MDPIILASLLLAPFLFGKKKTTTLTKGPNYTFYSSNLNTVDLTKSADTDIRKYKRAPKKIKGVVLHQTGFNWDDNNPNWNNVNAHFAITKDGKILVIHDPTWRLSLSSEDANENYISIEHEGNYRSVNDICYATEKFGCDLIPTKEQVLASRKLIQNLKSSYPNFKEVTAHIQWQDGKSNCPGPQIWYNVGEWVKKNLKLSDSNLTNELTWHDDRGAPIPKTWRESKYAINTSTT